jgi:DNA-binding XRE family transcriptional regulator
LAPTRLFILVTFNLMQEQLEEYLKAKRDLPDPAMRRAIREAAGATRDDVANEVGVTRYAVLQWELGTRSPSRRHLPAYVRVLRELRGVR